MYVITDELVQSIINCLETVKENMDINKNFTPVDGTRHLSSVGRAPHL